MDKMQSVKQKLGFEAAKLIENGMVVGLGTGSTAKFFIEALCQRIREEGLKFTAVATSEAAFQQAVKAGLQVLSSDAFFDVIDLTVDGADEIDPNKRLIKGKGGALLREKIVATASKEMIVIADETKLVPQLGQDILPIEVLPFGFGSTLQQIENMGIQARLRTTVNGSTFITDGGHWIYDLKCQPELYHNPQGLHHALINLPGVIETGLFIDIAGRMIIGHADGRLEVVH
ncbi:MAG: Ribose-5-phosphate isomerase [Chlamydiales bacterium]|jgi:ribose 5-phosphate isomerase A|nr:Ribose-5-phosphate isomerase [Chlamydiales bacterium]